METISLFKCKCIETTFGNLLLCITIEYIVDDTTSKKATFYLFIDTDGNPLNASNIKGWTDAVTNWGKKTFQLPTNLTFAVEKITYKLLSLYERKMMDCVTELIFGKTATMGVVKKTTVSEKIAA